MASSTIPDYVAFGVLSIVLGLLSLVFRRAFVDSSVVVAPLTERQRRRRETLQAAVGVILVGFGIAVLVFRLE
jgi:threonine/homoserine/homoserine lactone efflux protein